MFHQTSNGERFHILSLDGGGIKGIFSAAVLAAIEDDLHTKVVDHFDLIDRWDPGDRLGSRTDAPANA